MASLVLLRHGQSDWNQENRFTGWIDVDLTRQGIEEAHQAGRALREAGFTFDIAFTSLLKRAVRTLWIVLDEMDLMWLPVEKTWRLNERHYGALQGLDKAEMVDRYGSEQVFLWRRSYSIQPPPLDADDPRHPRFDLRYAQVPPMDLPSTESLENTLLRVMPCWQEQILPRLQGGGRVLIAAHGNSLRALVKHLEQISNEDIPALNIPLGLPLVYELNERQEITRKFYVGDPDTVRTATEAAARAAQVKGKRQQE